MYVCVCVGERGSVGDLIIIKERKRKREKVLDCGPYWFDWYCFNIIKDQYFGSNNTRWWWNDECLAFNVTMCLFNMETWLIDWFDIDRYGFGFISSPIYSIGDGDHWWFCYFIVGNQTLRLWFCFSVSYSLLSYNVSCKHLINISLDYFLYGTFSSSFIEFPPPPPMPLIIAIPFPLGIESLLHNGSDLLPNRNLLNIRKYEWMNRCIDLKLSYLNDGPRPPLRSIWWTNWFGDSCLNSISYRSRISTIRLRLESRQYIRELKWIR